MNGVINPTTITIETTANLADKEGYAVTLAGALATDGTAPAVPVNRGLDGSSTAQKVAVTVGGQDYFKLGGTVAIGDKLAPTTGSVWIATTTDTDNYGGIALQAGVSGDLVPALVRQGMIAG